VVSSPEYEYAAAWFAEGLAPVKKGEKWGYISKDWKIVIEPQFDWVAQTFSEGLAAVRVADKFGYIDVTGKMVIATRFASPSHFSEGFAAFREEGEAFAVFGERKYGYINRSGEVVIEPIFTAAGDFKGGLAHVTKDERFKYQACCWQQWDYIDKTGKYVWKAPEE